MKLIYVIVMLTLAAGCTTVHTTPVKIAIAPEYDFTVEQVAKVMEYATQEFNIPVPEGWTVVLADGYIPLVNPAKPNHIILGDGATVPAFKQIWIYPYQGCIADSALIHELAHLVGFTHSKEMSAEVSRIQKKAVSKFCPKDYVRGPLPVPSQKDFEKSPFPILNSKESR